MSVSTNQEIKPEIDLEDELTVECLIGDIGERGLKAIAQASGLEPRQLSLIVKDYLTRQQSASSYTTDSRKS